MKRTLLERINYRARKVKFNITHPDFKTRYSKRFNSDFNQTDLEYCVSNLHEFYLGKKLDLNNVNTFNEKLNWLKCFYHDDRMTECADKVTAPAYFKKQTGLGEEYIVKNLGVYSSADEIDFNALPNQFVLKLNCGSGKQIIVLDKKSADLDSIKSELTTWNDIKANHYYSGFEYGYKNIVPKIVCEEFIRFDYKIEFFCFNGKPTYFWTVYNDKTDEVCANFYDALSMEKINLKHGYPNAPGKIEVPKEYGQMLDIAKHLSEGFPFVRIDFFKTPEGFKFSEITFYHWCGFMPFEPASFDLEFGKHIILPEKII